MANFTFCRGRERTTTTFFFFSWTLIQSFRIQLQKKMPNIWRIKRDGISVIKFSATPIHFLSDVFVAVAVLVAYSSLLFYRGNVTPYPISFKSLNVSSINWILNIMVQFCYLRLYLGIETVSCRLLLRMWQGCIWIKTSESSANFFKRPACKNLQKFYGSCFLIKFVWDLLHNSTGTFRAWRKALSNDFSTELT